TYAPNVELLAPYLDEIELLFFESPSGNDDSLKNEIKILSDLAKQFSITYNVHLPTDISFVNSDPSVRKQSVESIKQVIDLTAPLSPTTCTLHLTYEAHSRGPADILTWQGHIRDSLGQLFDEGVNPAILSIETLSYPFQWIDGIIREFDLHICMDVGHLIVNHVDVLSFYRQYAHIIPIIHLHGVENSRDHLPLDRLSKADFDPVLQLLEDYSGIVSLEVFSYPALIASLNHLENACHPIGSQCP
ncbi:MAG: cobamide remodeling phosphodiesterase CbiR, partial [Desulfobacterales bacterium]